MCDLASSSVKSSNALTAKSQKRSKKGKRGRSSTGSLTEALNVTRITRQDQLGKWLLQANKKNTRMQRWQRKVGEKLKESRLGPPGPAA